MRGCWEAGAERAAAAGQMSAPEGAGASSAARRLRDFVPVETVRARTGEAPAGVGEGSGSMEPAVPFAVVDGPDAWGDRVSLFGDEA